MPRRPSEPPGHSRVEGAERCSSTPERHQIYDSVVITGWGLRNGDWRVMPTRLVRSSFSGPSRCRVAAGWQCLQRHDQQRFENLRLALVVDHDHDPLIHRGSGRTRNTSEPTEPVRFRLHKRTHLSLHDWRARPLEFQLVVFRHGEPFNGIQKESTRFCGFRPQAPGQSC